MTDIYIHITTELRVPCLHPTEVHLLHLVRIGYAMRSSPQGHNAPIIIRG